MRTTVLAVAALAVLTSSTRAHALGGSGVGLSIPEPVVAGVLGIPSTALTFTSLGLSSGLVAALAAGKRPSVGLAITSMLLSSASLAWNVAVLTQLTDTTWSRSTWAPMLIAGITLNAATIVFDVVTLLLRKEPAVVVAPIVLPSGAGASLSMRW